MQIFQDYNTFQLACYVINLLYENLQDINLQNILLIINNKRNLKQQKKTIRKLQFVQQKNLFLKLFFQDCLQQDPSNKKINFLYMEFLYSEKSFYQLVQYITMMKYNVQRDVYYKKTLEKIIIKTQHSMNNIYEKNQSRNNVLEFLDYSDFNNNFLNEVFSVSQDLNDFYKSMSLENFKLIETQHKIEKIIRRDSQICKTFQQISKKFLNQEILLLYYDFNDLLLYNEERILQLKDRLKYYNYGQQKALEFFLKDIKSNKESPDGVILIRGLIKSDVSNYGQIKYVSNTLEKIFDVNTKQFKGNIKKFVPYFQKNKLLEMIEKIEQQKIIWKDNELQNFYFTNLKQYLVFVQCEFNLFPLLLNNEMVYYFKIYGHQNRSSQNQGVLIFNKNTLNVISLNKYFCQTFQYSINLIEDECQDGGNICLKLNKMIQNFEQNNILEDIKQGKKLIANLCNIKIQIDGHDSIFDQKEYCSLQSQINIKSTVNLIRTKQYEQVFIKKIDEFQFQNNDYITIQVKSLQESQNKINKLKNSINNSQMSSDTSKNSYFTEGIQKTPKNYILNQKKAYEQKTKARFAIYFVLFMVVLQIIKSIIQNQLTKIIIHSDNFLQYQRSIAKKNLAFCQLYTNFLFYVQLHEQTEQQFLPAKRKEVYLSEINKYIQIINQQNNNVPTSLSQLFKTEIEEQIVKDKKIKFFDGYNTNFETELINHYGKNYNISISSDKIQMWLIVQVSNYLRYNDLSFFEQADYQIEQQYDTVLQVMQNGNLYIKNSNEQFLQNLKIFLIILQVLTVFMLLMFNFFRFLRDQQIYKSFYTLTYFEESCIQQFQEKLQTFNENYIYTQMTKSQKNLCKDKSTYLKSKILDESLEKMDSTIDNQDIRQKKIQFKKSKQLKKQIIKKNLNFLKPFFTIFFLIMSISLFQEYEKKQINILIQQNQLQNKIDSFFVRFQIYNSLTFRLYINGNNQDQKIQINQKYQLEKDFNDLIKSLKKQNNDAISYNDKLDQLLSSLCNGRVLKQFSKLCLSNIEFKQGIEVNTQKLLEKLKFLDNDQNFENVQTHYDILRIAFLDLSSAFLLQIDDKLVKVFTWFYTILILIVCIIIIIDFVQFLQIKRKIFQSLDFLVMFCNNPINKTNKKFLEYISKYLNFELKTEQSDEESFQINFPNIIIQQQVFLL